MFKVSRSGLVKCRHAAPELRDKRAGAAAGRCLPRLRRALLVLPPFRGELLVAFFRAEAASFAGTASRCPWMASVLPCLPKKWAARGASSRRRFSTKLNGGQFATNAPVLFVARAVICAQDAKLLV